MSATPDFASEPLWTPDPSRAASSQLARFAADVGLDLDFGAIHGWSVAHAPAFWREVWERCGMVGEPGEIVVDEGEPGEMWATRYFPDARLNVVDTILSGRGASDDDVALVSRDELGRRRTWTRGALRADVAAVAAALRDDGVEPGDRVAAWLPNIAETVVLMLGAAAVGATFSSTSPDFGVDGVVDRFGQIRPVVLVSADGYFYGGKQLDCLERLAEIRAALPSVRRTVLVGNLDWDTGSAGGRRRSDGMGRVARTAPRHPSCAPSRSRSTIPGTCCTRRAPPACRSASSTAPAACCCSTSRSISCTATSGRATASSTTRRAAG